MCIRDRYAPAVLLGAASITCILTSHKLMKMCIRDSDSTGAFMEVKVMNTRKILSAIGTFAVVGAVSTAGAALWTKVLNRKFQMVQLKLTHPKSDKIIFVDFKKAKRGR